MLGAAKSLVNSNDVKLYVAAVSPTVNILTKIVGEAITYYILPIGRGNTDYNLDYCPYWKRIKDEINPDIVHIHGTEYSHGYAYMKACGNDKVVISIQGLTSVYSYYYHYGISKKDICRNLTFKDLIRGTIIHGKHRFKKMGRYEIEMIQMARHIIGRTSWDRSHVWAVNPNAKYHFCNETLRPEFYTGELWEYEKCNKHSIFLSQAGYPVKGLHQVLKAMPLILRYYPDTIIRVAGGDIIKSATIYEKLRLSGYGRYIKRLIRANNLEDKIIFTGNLNAEQMKQEYLSANVFICPSTIENSPNSLGEAQILGTPCVASYVGGIPDMMKGNEDNLYRFEEVEMLAEKVCRVFANPEKQPNMRDIAFRRHNSDDNRDSLLDIYNQMQ